MARNACPSIFRRNGEIWISLDNPYLIYCLLDGSWVVGLPPTDPALKYKATGWKKMTRGVRKPSPTRKRKPPRPRTGDPPRFGLDRHQVKPPTTLTSKVTREVVKRKRRKKKRVRKGKELSRYAGGLFDSPSSDDDSPSDSTTSSDTSSWGGRHYDSFLGLPLDFELF